MKDGFCILSIHPSGIFPKPWLLEVAIDYPITADTHSRLHSVLWAICNLFVHYYPEQEETFSTKVKQNTILWL